MASLGHIAVGLAAARADRTDHRSTGPWLKHAAWWSALSMLPDADVIGFPLGIQYGDEWGHRGATHSLAFAVAVGILVGVGRRWRKRSAPGAGVTATLVVASHAVLDTLTNGGLGCALLWPFDQTRYFAPWTPIPVAPIGLAFLSPYGLTVAAVELFLFSPLFWFGIRPPGARTPRAWLVPVACVWLVGAWLLTSADPVRERVVAAVLSDSTEYAPGFSEQALRAVDTGDSEQSVRDRLGEPYYEVMLYEDRPDTCVVVRLERNRVTGTQPPEACRQRGVDPGEPATAVRRALGPPREWCWAYSRSAPGRFYRLRAVCFGPAGVTGVVGRWLRE